MDPASIVRKGCPVKLVCPQDGKAILWTGLAVGDRNRSVSDGGTDVPANEFPSSWRNELMRFTRSEEHTSELQSLMRISYAVFCLKKKIQTNHKHNHQQKSIQNNVTNKHT